MRVSSQAHYQAEMPEPVGPAGEIFHNYGLLCFSYYTTLIGVSTLSFLLANLGVQKHTELK